MIFIERRMCHMRVYLLWIFFVFTVVQRIIYFYQSVPTSFRLLCVPVNFLSRSVRFWEICGELILQYTSEATYTDIAVIGKANIMRVPQV